MASIAPLAARRLKNRSTGGVGSSVLTSLVATALAGRTTLSFDPAGIVWTLTCPAAQLAAVPERQARRRSLMPSKH